MANVIGKYLRGLMGPRVAVTITYPNPYEPPLLDPPEALPTSEPATAQIEITVTQDMLPTVTPASLEHVLTALLYASGQNTDGAQQTLYYRILKNGQSIQTGSASVAAGRYWAASCHNLLGVQVGDVVACKLWATSGNVNWDWRGMAILPTRIGPAKRALVNVSVTLASMGYPQFSRLTFGSSVGRCYLWCEDRLSMYPAAGSTTGIALVYTGTTYRIVQTYYGDNQFSTTIFTSTEPNRPTIDSVCPPTAISFRLLNLRL